MATRSLAEQTELGAWLDAGGFDSVPGFNPSAPNADVDSLTFEMLVVDAQLKLAGALMRAARYRPTPRPVIVVGEPDARAESEASQRGASYLARPFGRERLLFAVTLALAEERPMQRFPRKLVPRFEAEVDGMPVRVVDVSYEGVRLEVPERFRRSLRPSFLLRVPLFNVAVLVQRIWVSAAAGAASQVWCGGQVPRGQRGTEAWRMLVDVTPDIGASA